ncbi:MAG: outer membrane beta-barrel protein, partial [Bacteroidota bacterium]
MPSELFEKKLREKLSQAVIPPSPELWDQIEAKLPGDDKRRGLGFWLILLALLFGSIGLLLGFWNWQAQEELKSPISHITSLEPEEEKDTQEIPAMVLEQEDILDAKEIEKPLQAADLSKENLSEKQILPQNSKTQTSSTYTNSPYTTSQKLKSVLDINVSENLANSVPQHTNQAQNIELDKPAPPVIDSNNEQAGARALALKIQELSTLSPYPYLEEGLSNPQLAPLPLVTQRTKKWAFSFYVDGHQAFRNLSFRNLNEDALASGVEDGLSNPDPYLYQGLNSPANLEVEIPERSISFGLQVERKLNRRLSLQAGLEYGMFSAGFYDVSISPNSFSSPGPGTNERTANPLSQRKTQYAYHQLGLPVQINYNFFNRGRSSLEVYGGASLYMAQAYSKSILQSRNFYDFANIGPLGADVAINTVSQDVPGLLQYNRFHSTLQTGINYLYHFTDRYAIFVGPQLKYQLSPVYKEQLREIDEIPAYIGIRLGLRFS